MQMEKLEIVLNTKETLNMYQEYNYGMGIKDTAIITDSSVLMTSKNKRDKGNPLSLILSL